VIVDDEDAHQGAATVPPRPKHDLRAVTGR
jgi:hypothetical protein